MANYAISDGYKIVNVIVADSKEIAEDTTKMEAIETSGEPWIDWTLEEEGWRRPSPYQSWVWSGDDWEPPISMPNESGYNYIWNEEKINWDRDAIQPFPSWIKNSDGDWASPISYPQDGNTYIWDEDVQNWVPVGE